MTEDCQEKILRRLILATQSTEGDRIGCAAIPSDGAHHCRDVYFVRIEVVHRGVGTERGIKGPVVVEVPLILHALRRWG
jgi:hypothetical protein